MNRPAGFFLVAALTLVIGGATKVAFAQNLLPNPGFDSGLSGWNNGPFTSVWSADDAAGSPTSGSAEGIQDREEASGGSFLDSPCTPVLAGETYDVGADLRLPTGQTPGRVSFSVRLLSDSRCRDTVTTTDGGRIRSTETTGQWTSFFSQITIPEGVVAVTFELGMAKNETGGEVHAFADNVYLCLAGTCGPGAGTNTDACIRDETTACLLEERFEVRIRWSDFEGHVGSGRVMSFNSERAESDQSAFFWFFQPTNFEMGVKMVDACDPPFERFWVFVSGLTNVGFTVTVRNTSTGELRAYNNPLGNLPTTQADTDAYLCTM